MVQPKHLIVLLLAVCLSGCGGYAMFDPSAAFTSPVKQADWMKERRPICRGSVSGYEHDRNDSAASSKPEPTALKLAIRRKHPRPSPRLQSAPVVATAKPITVADAGDVAVPVAPVPQPAEKITAAARPRLSVPRRRRPDLFARHRHIGRAHQAHRHPRQRGDLFAVAADRRRGDPRLSPRSAADHTDRPFHGRRLRLGLCRNAQRRPTSPSACWSLTIPRASPTMCRPMSSAISTSSNRPTSWAAAMSCKARASTAIMRATISRTMPKSFTSISKRPIASRSNWSAKIAQLARNAGRCPGRGGADPPRSSGRRRHRAMGFRSAGCRAWRRHIENAGRDLSRAALGAGPDQFGVGARAARRGPAHRRAAPSCADAITQHADELRAQRGGEI